MPRASVILTTYNKPRDLERVLEGFRHQTLRDFELLVCDDGSGPETKAVVDAYRATVPFPVVHCWQDDIGFRAARSRNNGGRAAKGEVLVFCDGDCIPWRDYLERHVEAQRPGWFFAGERYLLEPDEANAVTVGAVASGAAFEAAPAREVKRVRSIARKDTFYRWTGLKPERPRLMTSNCSMPLEAFRAVNGLDQRYEGWGQEDEDLRRRLVVRGWSPGTVIGVANCLHLWHKADATFLGKRKLSPNWRYYERGFQLSVCRFGLVDRPLASLAARVTAADPALAAQARAALGLGEPGRGKLELEVVVDPDASRPAPRPSGQAEVTVLVSAAPQDALPGRARGAHLVLAPGLPVCGGELPKEEHPPVPAALERAGVKATRPLPDGPLGAATFAAAGKLLDALL